MCQLVILAVIYIPVASTKGRRLLIYYVVNHGSRFSSRRWMVISYLWLQINGFICCVMVTQNNHTRVRCRPCKTIESCRYLSQLFVGRRLIILLSMLWTCKIYQYGTVNEWFPTPFTGWEIVFTAKWSTWGGISCFAVERRLTIHTRYWHVYICTIQQCSIVNERFPTQTAGWEFVFPVKWSTNGDISRFAVGRRLTSSWRVHMADTRMWHNERVIPHADCWVGDNLHSQNDLL